MCALLAVVLAVGEPIGGLRAGGRRNSDRFPLILLLLLLLPSRCFRQEGTFTLRCVSFFVHSFVRSLLSDVLASATARTGTRF